MAGQCRCFRPLTEGPPGRFYQLVTASPAPAEGGDRGRNLQSSCLLPLGKLLVSSAHTHIGPEWRRALCTQVQRGWGSTFFVF